MARLVECIASVASHARRVDTDGALRRRLVAQQAEDRVPEDRCGGRAVFLVAPYLLLARALRHGPFPRIGLVPLVP